VVSDVPVDDEALLVTSRISRSAGAQSFGGAYRGRVCVPIHRRPVVTSRISRSAGAQSFGGAYRGRVCVPVLSPSEVLIG
jgi:hypothetical protein